MSEDLAREVAELRKVVIRLLEIVEEDKRNALRSWVLSLAVMLCWAVAWVVATR